MGVHHLLSEYQIHHPMLFAMQGHRLRRWPNIKTALDKRLMFPGICGLRRGNQYIPPPLRTPSRGIAEQITGSSALLSILETGYCALIGLGRMRISRLQTDRNS